MSASINLPASVLAGVLRDTAMLAHPGDPALTTIEVRVDPSGLQITGTDGDRLGNVHLPVSTPPEDTTTVLLEADTALAWAASLSTYPDDATITITDAGTPGHLTCTVALGDDVLTVDAAVGELARWRHLLTVAVAGSRTAVVHPDDIAILAVSSCRPARGWTFILPNPGSPIAVTGVNEHGTWTYLLTQPPGPVT